MIGLPTSDGRKKLAEFLAGTKQSEFARKVDCSESHLSLILKGERGMSFALAKRISAESGIPMEELPHKPVADMPTTTPETVEGVAP